MAGLVKFLDLSAWNGPVDWTAVRQNHRDVAGVFLRLREWRSTGATAGLLDAQVVANLEGALRVGLLVGGYHRINPAVNTPEREAIEMFSTLESLELTREGRVIPAVDIEPGEGADWSAASVDEFGEAWDDVSGNLEVRAYTSGSFVEKSYGGLADFDQLWIGHTKKYAPVQYRDQPDEDWAGRTPYTFGARTTVHQYTHSGRIVGIQGDVDINVLMPNTALRDLLL